MSRVCEPPTRINGNNSPRRIKRTWKFLKRLYAQHDPLAAVTRIHTGRAETYSLKVSVAYYEGRYRYAVETLTIRMKFRTPETER